MEYNQERRMLLKAATALGLSIGISALNIQSAAAGVFAKLDGIDGEWIPVEAVVRGDKLMVKNKKGKMHPAKDGTYRLDDRTVATVKNGKIISREKGAARASTSSNKR